MSQAVRVGVIFGGRTVEHEVSVISAQQAIAALPADRYEPVPIYIAKDGRWYTGEVLRSIESFRDPQRLIEQAEPVQLSTDPSRPGIIRLRGPEGGRGLLRRAPAPRSLDVERLDCILPVMHGSHGEDGTLQGLCELADIPFAGSDVVASAVCMDKRLTKVVLRAADIPVLADVATSRSSWEASRDATRDDIEKRLAYPMFVKPMSLGSSIGVARAADRAELDAALDVAFSFDDRAIIEPAQDNIIEVNCAVLGDGGPATRVSACEQPVAAGVLRYEDKYGGAGSAKGGGKAGAKAAPGGVGQGGKGTPAGGMESARRIIPAPIGDALTQSIQTAARDAFVALGCAGVVRIDFLVRPAENWFVLNEVNPIPGSLAFYLFEPVGIPFGELVTEVVELGRRRHEAKRASTYSIDSWLLSGTHSGVAGTKGGPT